MADYCTGCGTKLSFVQRMSGTALCPGCKEKRQALHQEALAQYPALLRSIWNGTVTEAEGSTVLVKIRVGLTEAEQAKINGEAFRSFAEEVLADDILTEEEEAKLTGMGSRLLGVTQEKFQGEYGDLLLRLFVARVNDGRLPTMPTQRIIQKAGEQVHLETNARLLKRVTLTRYEGGYSGFSFRIAKGVSYHTGGARGRRVEVGTQVKEEDCGVLVVTSQRAVFVGSSKSLEMPYSKLLSLEVFEDGVAFHLSNRKNSPLFRLDSGHAVAAAVNTAAQRLQA